MQLGFQIVSDSMVFYFEPLNRLYRAGVGCGNTSAQPRTGNRSANQKSNKDRPTVKHFLYI
jgi:hypothetical protein